MAVGFTPKPQYDFDDLLAIMAALRGEGGCPWDQKQTHRSIRANLIEETYEAAEAIDTGNSALLQEELGDVLFQVVFHARLEQEEGRFSIAGVIDGICKKLVVRHPHVFGGAPAGDAGQLMRSWDAIKKCTRGQRTVSDGMSDIPRAMPALMRSRKSQQKATRAGVQPPDTAQAAAMVRSALTRAEKDSGEAGARAVGDLLFAAVVLADARGTEPEEALTFSCDGFIERFARVEREAAAENCPLGELPPARLAELWGSAQ